MIVVSFFFQVIKSASEYCSSYAMCHVANICISPCNVYCLQWIVRYYLMPTEMKWWLFIII